jgi:hypothetical protein
MRRLVRVEGRNVIARFLTQPEKGAILRFPTHADAKRAAGRLITKLRLSHSDEEYDEHLRLKVELIRAYNALESESDED